MKRTIFMISADRARGPHPKGLQAQTDHLTPKEEDGRSMKGRSRWLRDIRLPIGHLTNLRRQLREPGGQARTNLYIVPFRTFDQSKSVAGADRRATVCLSRPLGRRMT